VFYCFFRRENAVRNRAMLEQIIEIMVSGQGNSCPGCLIGAGFLKCQEARRHSNFGRRRQRVGATLASYGGRSPNPRPLGGDFYYDMAPSTHQIARKFTYS